MTGADDPILSAPRAGSFFGRRKGKPLRVGQASAVEDLLPALRLDLATPAPADLKSLFRAPVERVYLESGFGGGEHLIALLEADPELGLIGIEPFQNGMAKALMAIEARGLADRVRLYDQDAAPLLTWLPEAALDRAYLLYPDPWPKVRHHKRRFVNATTLAAFARALKIGAEWRYASDWADYVNWTLRHIRAEPRLHWLATAAPDWHTPWDGWTRTRYEEKAIREGRVPCYLRFERRG